jgi:hypothetical protein
MPAQLELKRNSSFQCLFPKHEVARASVVLPSVLVLIKIPFSLFDLVDGLIYKF